MKPLDVPDLFGRHRPLFLHELQFPAGLRLLVLAPHPDDFDAIGVTLRIFRDNGNPIDLGVVTSGASGVEDEYCPEHTAKAALREEEQRASCRFFGLPEDRLSFLRLKEDAEGHPVETVENIETIRQYLGSRSPELVFLPHGNDTNLGHQRTYKIFSDIVMSEGWSLAGLLIHDPKTIQMRHDLYTVFGEAEAEWKGQLLRFHQSQHQRNLKTRQHGFDERILQVNRQIARELQSEALYAEAFELECYPPGG